MDLAQAEAVADLIESTTEQAAAVRCVPCKAFSLTTITEPFWTTYRRCSIIR